MADALQHSAFVFDLHLVCGGYAYYSTFTKWVSTGKHGRETRQPSTANVPLFTRALDALGRSAIVRETESDYDYSLRKRGWGVASEVVARGTMQQFLNRHECLKAGVGTYTDIEVAAEGVKSHTVNAGKRRAVMERDGSRCLQCGRTAADGVVLTMQHIRPHSRGGETTSLNLVVLCSECNHEIGDEHRTEFYELANLPHSVDIGLFREGSFQAALPWALQLSDNLMHTRCEVSY